ncbi:MAG: glycosyltransferase family 2 protein, partial [Thermodesulfobacteriota bacterium]
EGLRAVKTEWLHSVDSDTTVPGDYFTKLEREMSQYGSQIKCFQLNFAPSADSSRWARCEAEVDALTISSYVRPDGVFGLNGMNFIARREALLSIGGFAEDLDSAEDVEMGYRLYKAGVPVVFLPEVRIIHNYPKSLYTIVARKFWHGKGYQLMRGRRPHFISTIHTHTAKENNSSLFVKKFLSPWFVLYYLVVVPAFLSGYFWSWIFRKIKIVSAK